MSELTDKLNKQVDAINTVTAMVNESFSPDEKELWGNMVDLLRERRHMSGINCHISDNYNMCECGIILKPEQFEEGYFRAVSPDMEFEDPPLRAKDAYCTSEYEIEVIKDNWFNELLTRFSNWWSARQHDRYHKFQDSRE